MVKRSPIQVPRTRINNHPQRFVTVTMLLEMSGGWGEIISERAFGIIHTSQYFLGVHTPIFDLLMAGQMSVFATNFSLYIGSPMIGSDMKLFCVFIYQYPAS